MRDKVRVLPEGLALLITCTRLFRFQLSPYNVVDIMLSCHLLRFSIGFKFDPSAIDPMQVVLLFVVPTVRLHKTLRRFDGFRHDDNLSVFSSLRPLPKHLSA
jgi:hypothetical protein